ncbi:MAG: hypothetical protein C4542_02150 [Dehalococcoidia bacterium]|nr:MAG: hypothetical protein C4542_02150 [Dehalococcoidia bacterium]
MPGTRVPGFFFVKKEVKEMRLILLLMLCVSLLALPLAAHAHDAGIPPGEWPDPIPLPIIEPKPVNPPGYGVPRMPEAPKMPIVTFAR